MLKDRCHINTNRKTDTFVGLKFDGKNYTVSFPLGYAIASEDDDKLLREDLLLLFQRWRCTAAIRKAKAALSAKRTQRRKRRCMPISTSLWTLSPEATTRKALWNMLHPSAVKSTGTAQLSRRSLLFRKRISIIWTLSRRRTLSTKMI